MNARFTPPEAALEQVALPRLALLEDPYHQYPEKLIAQAVAVGVSAAPYLRDLNQVAALTAGLGVVMRIMAGTPVVADQYDPADPNSEPPLSSSAINALANMGAEICELIADNISRSADRLDKQVRP